MYFFIPIRTYETLVLCSRGAHQQSHYRPRRNGQHPIECPEIIRQQAGSLFCSRPCIYPAIVEVGTELSRSSHLGPTSKFPIAQHCNRQCLLLILILSFPDSPRIRQLYWSMILSFSSLPPFICFRDYQFTPPKISYHGNTSVSYRCSEVGLGLIEHSGNAFNRHDQLSLAKSKTRIWPSGVGLDETGEGSMYIFLPPFFISRKLLKIAPQLQTSREQC